MTVYVVIDHICEGDIVVGVFSSSRKAKDWIMEHKDDPYSPTVSEHPSAKRYDCLDVEEHVLDDAK